MNVKYNKDGKLEFDLSDLLDCVTGQSKVELIESLSCDEAILKHVVDQILDGWTESCCCGASGYDQQEVPRYQLDRARREISKRSGEVVKDTIEKLEKTIAAQKKELDEYRQKELARWERQRSIL